ncbi:hypothetical protein [Pelagicoccus sp. SDUM812005]|uniref:hypothetical protein n=1 Tax=Pelagicoccus sp. SDUM812005 TaxID=3041257 RepID=UPI00280FFDA2|nr:hypothetical protein [Pelagicoccus sp. SDUM812005]MDQ8181704.1 hypothetical protein [Pelagicoccus sp. SDUM812005]
MKIALLPPVVAFLMLCWFVFSPPIRPLPTLLAVMVFAVGLALQVLGGLYSLTWASGIVVHVAFAIVLLVRRQLEQGY